MNEKTLPFQVSPVSADPSSKTARVVRFITFTLFILAYFFWTPVKFNILPLSNIDSENLCPQAAELTPQKNGEVWQVLSKSFTTDGFRTRAINWLGGAVRVPTESYDSMGPIGVDPRWDAFGPFHDYLLKAFPLVHATLNLTKVNTYGLVYHWRGFNSSLKPILMAAHQDVVPVHPNTVDQWTHPPYSGYFDGDRIWGRGSSDDKSGLIGVMASIEILLEQNFQPTRSVVLAFGFDEEASGLFGAATLAEYLLPTYGKDGFALLIDEGAGFEERLGAVIATVGIAEKGYADVRIDVASPGGHSSIPPVHTSIGMLSALLVEYESNPLEVHLARNTPVYRTVQCLAEHAPKLPSKVKTAVTKSVTSNKALKEVEEYFFQDSAFKSLAATTQAIDLIGGGVKTNALPEQAWAVVNHRIATESSLGALELRDTELLKPLATEFNLSYSAFGVNLSDKDAPAYGSLTLSHAFHVGLEPAPITPTDDETYQLFSGTIKATYNAHRSLQGDNIAIVPSIMSGNTDTVSYWDLTKHIFRYNHQNQGNSSDTLGNIHTVDEYIFVDSFLEMILFFTTLILNADESTTLS